jgi:hypothetical protein
LKNSSALAYLRLRIANQRKIATRTPNQQLLRNVRFPLIVMGRALAIPAVRFPQNLR